MEETLDNTLSDNTLIEIRDMKKIYNPGENEVHALDGVDLTICEREFVAIIGHSGSGKSTLMNMLGCLDVPTTGTYRLHGVDVSDMEDDELSDVRNREIGFIFQGFNLIQNLTAVEKMSGVQQLRVAIARAIAQAPPIILADEPTGNLDSNSTTEIMQILRELHSEGRTVILITHDNEIAEQADRVIKIRDGKIVSDTRQNQSVKQKDMEDEKNE